MDKALVKYAEDDVDSEQRGENEQGFIAADSGVGGSGSLKADDHAGRHMEARLCAIDGIDRLAQRSAFCNIEGYGYHGKLALVRDGERGGFHLEMREGGEGHGGGHGAGGGGAPGRDLTRGLTAGCG